jgi:hypothetical protein
VTLAGEAGGGVMACTCMTRKLDGPPCSAHGGLARNFRDKLRERQEAGEPETGRQEHWNAKQLREQQEAKRSHRELFGEDEPVMRADNPPRSRGRRFAVTFSPGGAKVRCSRCGHLSRELPGDLDELHSYADWHRCGPELPATVWRRAAEAVCEVLSCLPSGGEEAFRKALEAVWDDVRRAAWEQLDRQQHPEESSGS